MTSHPICNASESNARSVGELVLIYEQTRDELKIRLKDALKRAEEEGNRDGADAILHLIKRLYWSGGDRD